MPIVVKKNYLVATKINVGSFFGGKDEEGFIELCEPQNDSFFKLRQAAKAGDDSLREVFIEVLPSLIVDHNLFQSEEQKLSSAEIVDLVKERPLIYIALVDTYTSEVIFSRGRKSAGK
jgi:hypothetical protein